jgi:hypothetical protein
MASRRSKRRRSKPASGMGFYTRGGLFQSRKALAAALRKWRKRHRGVEHRAEIDNYSHARGVSQFSE